jgi:hypothetical protein
MDFDSYLRAGLEAGLQLLADYPEYCSDLFFKLYH